MASKIAEANAGIHSLAMAIAVSWVVLGFFSLSEFDW